MRGREMCGVDFLPSTFRGRSGIYLQTSWPFFLCSLAVICGYVRAVGWDHDEPKVLEARKCTTFCEIEKYLVVGKCPYVKIRAQGSI